MRSKTRNASSPLHLFSCLPRCMTLQGRMALVKSSYLSRFLSRLRMQRSHAVRCACNSRNIQTMKYVHMHVFFSPSCFLPQDFAAHGRRERERERISTMEKETKVEVLLDVAFMKRKQS
ncbi:hypothetical protein CSUI_009289 [Cystoisospora suis]|uniref:Uncharacterized protein n=1 Tax=Cystoisospora suis TaxID=483139 RepID=A0A2C6KKI2_9APIC|nr:hypothetical protein CSUI_009289 [Cystoisospora suis]